jgi:hypothetical protein
MVGVRLNLPHAQAEICTPPCLLYKWIVEPPVIDKDRNADG